MTDDAAQPSPAVDHVKVRFELEQDETGWPPASSEGLWALPVGDDLFELDNNPWFAMNVAAGDVFRARPDGDGVLWAVERVRSSGNNTIRVIPSGSGPMAGDRQAVLDAFAPFGVDGEGIEQFGMVSLNVPTDLALAEIKGLLQRGERDGWWDYDEGCIGDAWKAADA
jgi:hypothetical protein